MDAGRKFDLEELAEAIKNARSSGEKQLYEKLIHKILSESEDLKYWRENLLRAIRINDKKTVHRINLIIQDLRLRETNGASWGNDKGNKRRMN